MDPPELPECPVCLQPFDGDCTIPRVLACGHSACQTCLIELPKPTFPGTIRCPACTQLVSFPHPQGPSALPKNIDLLRFSSSLILSNTHHNSSNSSKPPSKPIKESFQDFIPNLWSREFYSTWKDWVVSEDKVSVELSVAFDGSCLYGRVMGSEEGSFVSPISCLLKCHTKVSLLKVGSFLHSDDSSKFKYSYIAKVMRVLFEMSDGVLDELGLILRSSLKDYRICTAYGLWYNEEDKGLYLVCERKGTSLSNVSVSGIEDDISWVAVTGMELCEVVSGLHEAELVTGCFALSCFAISEFRHVSIDLGEVLAVGGRIQKIISMALSLRQNNDGCKESETNLRQDLLDTDAFLSPELLSEFLEKEGIELGFGSSKNAVGSYSDVWSLACIMLWLLEGNSFVEATHNYLCSIICLAIDGNSSDCEGLYMAWLEKVSNVLDTRLVSEYAALKELLQKSLHIDPTIRPPVSDLWKCMRKLIVKPNFDVFGNLEQRVKNESTGRSLLLGELSQLLQRANKLENENGGMGDCKVEDLMAERDVIEGLSEGSLKCIDLKGHLDCITGLAIGGGFLFSSSFDKTVNVWSIQDFGHVHSFKGHEHRVTAVAFVDREQPLCISVDNGGGIFIWGIGVPFEQEPVKRLNEEKDWRYSGIHALAVSGSEFLYTGSGDKSIKAWSMHDYTLSSTMTGHKSVVSALAVSNGVLYSGSWDGTVRLWCLNDHSPLAVLGEETPGSSTSGSVLSLAADSCTLVAAHENGSIKIWNNDVLLKSTVAHIGAIFSVTMEGKWLFSGGWNKTIIVQELLGDESQGDATKIGTISGDSIITALLYWQGKLFVGQADSIIKVYYCGR